MGGIINLEYREKSFKIKICRLIFISVISVVILLLCSVNLNALIIGGKTGGYYNGTIDELRIYSRALTADEIKMHYLSEIQRYNSTQYRFYINITDQEYGTYYYYGWANDTAENPGQSETRVIILGPVNTPPTIIANVTKPDTVYTDTDWKLNLTITDPNVGDTLTAYTQFYVNGTASDSLKSLNVTNNTNTNVANLSNSSFGKGATLIAEFWAGDGTDNTTKENTTQVTVQSLPNLICVGTLNCPVYSTQGPCENCSQCKWSVLTNYSSKSCGTTICYGGDGCTSYNLIGDGCSGATCDGTETVNNIWLNGTTFKIGDTINVIAEIESYESGEHIGFHYYNGSTWDTFCEYTTTAAETKNYSRTFNIIGSEGTQFIRVTIISKSGVCDNCPDTNYGEYDDISFAVVSSGGGCFNNGSCVDCDLDECDTNCSAAGCSIENPPPVVTANITKPDTVYTNTTWIFNMTVTDPDTSPVTGYVQFYVNDTPSGSVVIRSIENDTNTNVANLSSSDFGKDANLTAEFWAGDGIDNTTKENTTQVTVKGYGPIIIANITKPDTVYTNTDWKLNITAIDPNNLTFTIYVQFYVNDTPSGSVLNHSISNNTNTNIANLSNSSFGKGATLIAEFWAGDGTDNTTKYNTSEVNVFSGLNLEQVHFRWRNDNGREFGYTTISTGIDFSCGVLNNGSAMCWGINEQGRLGDGSTTQRLAPVQVKGVGGSGYLTNVSAISAGFLIYAAHTCAVKNDGTAYCWGNNGDGELGDDSISQRLAPVQVKGVDGLGYLTDISAISAGESHTCAVKSNGSVYCWGYNNDGECGDGTSGTDRRTPVQVRGVGGSGYLTDISAISAGGYHSCALKNDSTVYCWGYNNDGQIGDGTSGTSRTTPLQVRGVGGSGYLTDISAISAGAWHTCALKNDSTVYCWGTNGNAQLGINSLDTPQTTPVQVKGVGGSGYLTDVLTISAAAWHTCAVKNNGSAYCWGYNGNGELGDDSITQRPAPVQVKGVGGSGYLTDVLTISGGDDHTCAVKNNGTPYCWGHNGNGELGDDSITEHHTPVSVKVSETSATWMAAEDTATTVNKNVNIRVRFSIKNTGNVTSNYYYRLQWAELGGYENCNSVLSTSFFDVPIQSECGTSSVCMANSPYFTGCPEEEQESAFHHLSDVLGYNFVLGKMVDSNCNQTAPITVNSNQFTEIEYNLNFTDNSVGDSTYCFRIVANRTEIKNYTKVANITITDIENTAPTITANVTSPTTVYTNTDLMLNLTVTDPDDGDTLTGYVQFYVNGIANGSVQSTSPVTNNTNTLIGTLGSGNFSKDYNLIAEFWAGDGSANTTKYNATEVIVQNSVPTIQVQNTFVNCSAGHCFNVTAGVLDFDGGSEIVKTNISTANGTCHHYSNTTTGNYFNVTFNCSGIALQSTDIIIGFNDSSGAYVQTDQSSNVYPDHAPTLISDPAINDTSPKTDSILNCDAGNYEDVDNDAQGTSNWKWFKNAAVISDEISQTLNLSIAGNGDKGDNIICSEQPTNIYANGLYYNSSQQTIGNTPPTQPILTSPANNSYINSINMTWTASFDADGDTVYYHVLVNGTQACYTDYLNCSYDPSDGYYQWNVIPYDETENGTTSDSWYYTYDSTNPSVSITYPTADQYIKGTTLWVNGTATETNEDTITINNTNWGTNQNTYSLWAFKNTSAISDGAYSIKITANDSAENVNDTETVSFTVDNTNPTLTITTSNNTVSNILTTIEGTASDTNNDSIYANNTAWTWNNTYTSWKFTNNTNIADGLYHILIIANDSAGNTNSSLFAFTYDTTSPIYSDVGKNNSNINVNDIVLFYANWSDSLAGLNYSIFSWNNSGSWENESAPLTGWSNITKTVTASKDKTIGWIIYANDSAGNWNNTGTQTFTVNNTAPTIVVQNTFVNCSAGHCFNVTAGVQDLNGGIDIVKTNISTTGGGSCYNIANSTDGNYFNSTWNCSGTALTSTNIIIGFNDSSGAYVQTDQSSNVYPDQVPTLETNPVINDTTPGTYDILNCNAGTYNDVDNDAKGTSNWKWFKNAIVISLETSQTLNLSEAGNGDVDDQIICSEQPTNTYGTGIYYNSSPPIQIVEIVVTPISPANAFIVDRDSVNASAADSVDLVAELNDNKSGIMIIFKANLTMPSIAGEVNIVLGNATSNSSGQANITWDGKDNNSEKMYAGNYTWWAESNEYPSNGTRFIYLYQGLNLSYRYADKYPDADYTQGDIANFEMFLDSPGPETRTQINSTYLAKVNSTLTDPTGTNYSIELLDPGEDEPPTRNYNPLGNLVEDSVPLNPLENLAQEPVPSSASPSETPSISKLFEFVKAIIRKIKSK